MAFTGNEPHMIPLDEASAMTKNYRNTISTGDVIAHYFGQKDIQKILDQEGCVGIRIYYALNDSGKKQLVVVGVDANENDLYNGYVADNSYMCPVHCSTANPLNS